MIGFMNLVKNNDVEAVREYLGHHPNSELNLELPFGLNLPPLHFAAIQGMTQMLSALLEVGCDVNSVTQNCKCTALQLACLFHDENTTLELVDVLVQVEGVDLDPVTPCGMSPLILGIIRGHVRLVEMLCEHGANINQSCYVGHPPGHFLSTECLVCWLAAPFSHCNYLQYLHEESALESDSKSNSVSTGHQFTVFQVLKNFVEFADDYNYSFVLDFWDEKSMYDMLTAMAINDEGMLKKFISHGGLLTNLAYNTPLHVASMCYVRPNIVGMLPLSSDFIISKSKYDIVKLLVEKGG